MIGDPGFAGGVDDLVGEFGNDHAAFHAAGGPQIQQPRRVQKFIGAVQHVEFDFSDREQPFGFGPAGQVGRRISVTVEREESMTMQIVPAAFRLSRFRGLREFFLEFQYRGFAFHGIEADQSLMQGFQQFFCVHLFDLSIVHEYAKSIFR